MGDRLKEAKQTEVVEKDALSELLAMPVGGDIRPVVPQTFDQVFQMADAIIAAEMVPLGLKGKTDKETRSKVGICIQKGLEVGFAPVTSLSRISVINGRPCIDCEGAMAKALESGKLEYCKEHFEGQGDERTAVCILKRRGVDEPMTRKFSVADAKRAGLWGNHKRQPWIQYPQRMLPIRARAWALRDLFSDVLAGLHIMEEVRDIPPPPDKPDTSFLDDEGVIDVEPEAETEPEPDKEPHPYVANMERSLAECATAAEVETLWQEQAENRKTAIEGAPEIEAQLNEMGENRLRQIASEQGPEPELGV